MRMVTVNDWNDWRNHARELLIREVKPEEVLWESRDQMQPALFSMEEEIVPAASETGPTPSVPRAFLELGEDVALHRDARRWALLYRMLWRLNHGERRLLEADVDPSVRELMLMQRSVKRDIHKMHAFVRFRKVEDRFVAWHRPDHRIVEKAAPWFAERFGSMCWAILTPDQSAFWDKETITYGPGVPRREAPADDELEELWRSYYAAIFNPARLKVRAMKAEMPVRHWATLPEAELIPSLILQAEQREADMRDSQKTSAAPFLPEERNLPVMAAAVQRCRGCDLYLHATQAVFGEGTRKAEVMFVGEQPGDQEDVQGKPFVGPAGRILDRGLDEAGIDRSLVYVTNAVKHFKFEERGKRRIHKTPRGVEVAACRPWLEAEIEAVKPKLLVALGSTAATALAGKEFRITRDRGQFFPHALAPALLATVHPSYLLRVPDAEQKEIEYARFVEDLRKVKGRMEELMAAK